MRVTVLGLGEAGSPIAADLARAGDDVHGFDPAEVPTPDGVTRHDDPGSAVIDATLVIAATVADDSSTALTQACHVMGQGTIYADCSTAPPSLKEELAAIAAPCGLTFVDVALMGTVPGNGLATPALASGPGAASYAEIVNERGGEVEVLGDQPGDASARKLLRSVVTKGLTSVVIEGLQAAEARESGEWMWDHIVEFLTDFDERLLERLVGETPRHIRRRIVEMESARDFLASLGAPPAMTAATVEALRRVEKDGLPDSVGRRMAERRDQAG